MAPWNFFDRYFPRSRRRAAKGGIRAQGKRGALGGESWWAKRWISVLERFDLGGRLTRGRSYARSGQVLSVEVAKGRIDARVQGSRPRPYQVSIGMKPLGANDWKTVADVVSKQAIYASKLLAGEMPREIEEAFREARVALFPEKHNDLKTECSCPDWSNPCKHIAAVYYLLGEEFDRDPFLLFRLRGMGREEFIRLMGQSQVAKTDAAPKTVPEPLPAAPSQYWASPELPEDLIGQAPLTHAGAAMALRLGRFPFWRGSDDLETFLESVYAKAALSAADKLERTADGESR